MLGIDTGVRWDYARHATVNMTMNPIAHSIGVSETMLSHPHRRDPAQKILMPVGTAVIVVAAVGKFYITRCSRRGRFGARR